MQEPQRKTVTNLRAAIINSPDKWNLPGGRCYIPRDVTNRPFRGVFLESKERAAEPVPVPVHCAVNYFPNSFFYQLSAVNIFINISVKKYQSRIKRDFPMQIDNQRIFQLLQNIAEEIQGIIRICPG